MKRKARNVFEHVKQNGDCGGWEPKQTDFPPTDLRPGSQEKIELMRMRLELGLPMIHPHDRSDFEGITYGVTPKKDGGRNVETLTWRHEPVIESQMI